MDIDLQSEILAQKIRHLIITNSGHSASQATIEEFYQAFCLALREEIMVNSTATIQTFKEKKPRMLNFISMEHLPGRLFSNNVTNMGANEIVLAVLKKMDRNLEDLISCETDPGLGNGGLGRLASCFLDSLATLKYPARAYGLRYQYGIFEQELWNGEQVERPECWLLTEDPWEIRRDAFAASIHFRGRPVQSKNKHCDDVYLLEDFEEVRALPFDIPILGYCEDPNYTVLILRLWTTKESPRNFQLQRYNAGFLDKASENTSLTDVLYPNENNELGKRVRLKQEFVLVSASLQDIIRRHLNVYSDLSTFSDKVRIQINDTHPALIIAEIVRTLSKNYDFSFQDAWETCKACCSYTNHTILKESLEEWNEHRVQELLPRQYHIIQNLNQMLCNSIRAKYPNNEEKVKAVSMIENGQIRMAHLSIFGSHKVNGVSRLHGEILKNSVFHDFFEMDPEKFTYITNGVTQRRWILNANPLLADFLIEKIGKDWLSDFSHIKNFRQFVVDKEVQDRILQIKAHNKERLIEFMKKECPVRDEKGKILYQSEPLGAHALFDVQIKRIHEYKRQLMNILHLIMIYQENERRKVARMVIFAGKAAPGYRRAKQIIQLINAVAKKINQDDGFNQHLKIIFVENYNVTRAEKIIPAADLSEQISTAGWEASGTGNMKLAMNGALTIGTDDGANIEMREAVTEAYWPFQFGEKANENGMDYQPQSIIDKDEQIKRAVESLKNDTFATNDSEREGFDELYQTLTNYDLYKVIKDLRAYYETQKKVEELYLTPNKWAETVIHNISSMGPFSTDDSIQKYAKHIWQIEPCPSDPKIVEKVREEYSEHDRCKIQPSKSN